MEIDPLQAPAAIDDPVRAVQSTTVAPPTFALMRDSTPAGVPPEYVPERTSGPEVVFTTLWTNPGQDVMVIAT
jgi:hypothetical protein